MFETDESVNAVWRECADDFVHKRDDGIGKVRLRERNRGIERGRDRGRFEPVAGDEETDNGGLGVDESIGEDHSVEGERRGWERSFTDF